MGRVAIACAAVMASGLAFAENLEGVDEMICSAGQAQICLENGECYSATPWELSIPDFVIINTKKKTIATTKASGQNRSSDFSSVEKADGLIYLQGIENQRAFSFVIDEVTGRMTVAVSRDGLSVSVFGACTDANI